MQRRLRTILIRLLKNLTFIVITLLMLEAALRIFNPLGAYGLVYDVNIFNGNQVMSDWGRVMQSGFYEMYNSTMTIDENHYRVIPDNHPGAGCTIALIGDSVTLGYRVNDDETWANHIATAFPQVNFINVANQARNIDDALIGIQAHEDADGYLYLVVNNDHEAQVSVEYLAAPSRRSAIAVYALALKNLLAYRQERDAEEGATDVPMQEALLAHFYAVLDDIVQDERTLVIGFEGDYDFPPPVQQIPPYTDVISQLDPHPNPQGHMFIAVQMRPVLEAWLPGVCNESE